MCESNSGKRRDDGKKNEFSALIIAKMAVKICAYDGTPAGRGKWVSEANNSDLNLSRKILVPVPGDINAPRNPN
jgi:hypothetical protein